MKRRLPKISHWLAGIYLVWSLAVFFGSLVSDESHSWWPLFLYPIIWPLSALYERLSSICLDWLIPDPKLAADWVWTLNDFVAVVVGTIWICWLGRLVSKIVTRIFPFKDDQAASCPEVRT